MRQEEEGGEFVFGHDAEENGGEEFGPSAKRRRGERLRVSFVSFRFRLQPSF